MANGRPWTEEHTAILRRDGGRVPDAKIAEATGHSVITVRKRRDAMGIPGCVARSKWSRRDWLLHSAAGLDFEISFRPI